MNIRLPLLLSFLLLLLTMGAVASPAAQAKTVSGESVGFDAARLERVRSMLQREVDAKRYAGASWLVLRDGKVATTGALGLADVATARPMREDAVVRIFSMTKIVTSVTALTLVEEGWLGLNDPVHKYLPELKDLQVHIGGTADAPKLERAKRAITVRHLLTHTSGLYYDFSVGEPLSTLWRKADFLESPTLREAVRRVATLPLAHQPGDRWTYGMGTDVLGAVIEVVTGQDLETAMRERVFAPLGMRETTFRLTPALQARLATIHERGAGGTLRANEEWTRNGSLQFPSGGGGLFSTLHDCGRFGQMLLNEGELDGVRVLGRKTVEFMLENQVARLGPEKGAGLHMGLGVAVRRLEAEPWSRLGSPGAYGWSGAATTDLVIDPAERMVLVLLMQHAPFNEDAIFDRFANTVYQALE